MLEEELFDFFYSYFEGVVGRIGNYINFVDCVLRLEMGSRIL